MEESLRNFSKQFEYRPVVENGSLGDFRKFVVAGMGGSNLAADLVKILRPDLEIIVHRDYGLPAYVKTADKAETLAVLSSFSGNTEETLDAYEEAGKRGIARIALGVGGKLLEKAAKDGVPFIKFPADKIQPRMALGWSFLAHLKVIGDEKLLKESTGLAEVLKPDFEEKGKKLAMELAGAVPVIYASSRNKGISYFWKIVLNETGKIPAFANVLPELNHNEMTGFDIAESTKNLSEKFVFVFLRDNEDNPRILKRMEILKGLYEKRGFKVRVLELTGSAGPRKIFDSFLTAGWTAYHLAEKYGVEPGEVPMVEEFKKLIQ